ncbi:MAG TPA: TrmH family RNA methyltransferase [Terriglobales bacterium]
MAELTEYDRLSVVLVNTRNPLNIGAVARAMTNFGFLDLRLVKPYPASFREARSAVGASAVLAAAREYESVSAAVADGTLVVGTTSGARRELEQPLELLGDVAKIIHKQLSSGRVAILFGSEKRGLSNDDLSHCHLVLRVPTHEGHSSMNLGQAVAVCLYELARSAPPARASAKPAGKTREKSKPPSGDLERITSLLVEAMRLSGYVDLRREASTEEKARRMVRRLDLTGADSKIWLGMLRQMVWKMKQSN